MRTNLNRRFRIPATGALLLALGLTAAHAALITVRYEGPAGTNWGDSQSVTISSDGTSFNGNSTYYEVSDPGSFQPPSVGSFDFTHTGYKNVDTGTGAPISGASGMHIVGDIHLGVAGAPPTGGGQHPRIGSDGVGTTEGIQYSFDLTNLATSYTVQLMAVQLHNLGTSTATLFNYFGANPILDPSDPGIYMGNDWYDVSSYEFLLQGGTGPTDLAMIFPNGTGNFQIDAFQISVVPEPSTVAGIALLMLGGVFYVLRRRRSAADAAQEAA